VDKCGEAGPTINLSGEGSNLSVSWLLGEINLAKVNVVEAYVQ